MSRPKPKLFRCPCCDYETLAVRGSYYICCVCRWEDDGQDELDVVSGPNRLTLRQARANFLAFGACDEPGLLHAIPVEERRRFLHRPRTR